MVAARAGYLDTITTLLKRGADPLLQDVVGMLAVSVA